MTWFFTSDWHMGHANIIKYCTRPFKSVDEMNAKIIDNINEVVLPSDILINLGDVVLKSIDPDLLLSRINCKNLFLIPGNHDREHLLRKWFKVWPQCHIFSERDYRLVLCHYAMRVWPHSHHGAGHLYGHSHGTLSPMITSEGKGAMAFDVGVDCWDFKPLSLDQVKKEMTRRSCTAMDGKNNEIDDHHKPRN